MLSQTSLCPSRSPRVESQCGLDTGIPAVQPCQMSSGCFPISRAYPWAEESSDFFWEVCVGLGRGGRNRAFDHSYLKTVNGQVQGLGRGWGLSWD